MEDEVDDSIVSLFDSACLSYGDWDAIVVDSTLAICYYELQEHSNDLARQLFHRFRPSYVLVDCLGHVPAEAVVLLACMRISVEFVPVSCHDQHAGGRLNVVVQELKKSKPTGNIVAVVCCNDDQDPLLGVLIQANVHQVLYVDETGNLRERLRVPDSLPTIPPVDNMYVLFTSGTSTNAPKAVVGSHSSTLQRLKWFQQTFEPSSRIGRRTRLTFVDSITELFGALIFEPSSTTLVAVHPQTLQSEGIGALLNFECTQLTLLPSQLSQVLLLPHIQCLERVICSGEPCSPALVETFKKVLPKATLINLYGQTETTGDVLCAILTDMPHQSVVVNNVVAVGKPIPPNEIDIQNGNELVITGQNLSNGYLNSGDLVFDKFATGDCGFCIDGIWYVQGRMDDMAKVNGVLTSPTEVESVFSKMYSIDMVAATIIDSQVYVMVEHDIRLFSREIMKEAGLPWNLIPKDLIVHAIPRKSTGAGKMDRMNIKQIVEKIIHLESQSNSGGQEQEVSFESLLAHVLKVASHDLDVNKSFVELGGDSASSISFLYLLRSHNLISRHDLTAVDILLSSSIKELRAMSLSEERIDFKRHRRSLPVQKDFQPSKTLHFSSSHLAIQFCACVDAPPLFYQGMIYGACQGGLVQRLNLDGKMESYRYFVGWMIQAGLVIYKNAKTKVDMIIVSAHTREDRGLVVALDLNLTEILWKHEFDDGGIRATPMILDGKLWICQGQQVRVIRAEYGEISSTHSLPFTSITRPFLWNHQPVYISSDYESGLMLMAENGSFESSFSDVVGPAHKNPIIHVQDESVFISDSYGNLHRIHQDKATPETIRISQNPISSACIVGSNLIVVGCYDSILYCIDYSDSSSRVIWEFNAKAIIYAAPVRMADRSIALCTTAGDVIRVSDEGRELWRARIAAEIWSDPMAIGDDRIAFGARDSRLHIMSMVS